MAERNDGKANYEYVVYDRSEEKTKVVAEGKVLASSRRTAELTAVRSLDADVDLDKVEVVVRAFG